MRKNSVKNIRINSEDLKFAKIYVSVLGDDEAKEKTMEGLKKSAAYARHQLAHRMNLRNTPELTFILDTSIEYGVEMSKKIRELNHRDEDGGDSE